MRQKSGQQKLSADKAIKDYPPCPRKSYSAEEKIRIVLEGLRGEDSIAALCRREGIAESMAYTWSKNFSRPASGAWLVIQHGPQPRPEVKALRRETRDLK